MNVFNCLTSKELYCSQRITLLSCSKLQQKNFGKCPPDPQCAPIAVHLQANPFCGVHHVGLAKSTSLHYFTLSRPSILLCNAGKCLSFNWDFPLENHIAHIFFTFSTPLSCHYKITLSCPNYCLLSARINQKYP